MKRVFLLILVLATSQVANARVERDEAWLTQSSFDGHTFNYQYIAYGNTDGVIKEEVQHFCHSGYVGRYKILTAVDFRIFISGQFTDSKLSTTHSGSVDVAAALKSCLQADLTLNRTVDYPVALSFPRVSTSSRLAIEP